jgi:hypothetical protein
MKWLTRRTKSRNSEKAPKANEWTWKAEQMREREFILRGPGLHGIMCGEETGLL